MTRFWIALGALALVGASAWFTLSDERFRYAVVVVLTGIAVKIWIEQKRREAVKQQEVGRE